MKTYLRIVAMLLILAMAVSVAACGSSSQDQEKPGQTEVKPEVVEPVRQYIEVSREGMVDRIPVEIISGVAADYTIAMDPEYFSFRSDGEYDTFSYDEWEGDVNVYYTIYPYPDTTPQELADGLVHMYGGDYADCMTEQAAVGLYDATVVYLYDDLRGNGGQMRFYLIGTDYGCLVIEAQFVTEMYEGLYAIMRACFDTLTLTDEAGGDSITLTDAVFCGTWRCFEGDGDSGMYALILTLSPDGKAEYRYGYPDSEALESFSGTWTEDDGCITLEMVGGPPEYGDFYDTTIRFEWEIDDDDLIYDIGLAVRHDGESSPFLYGGEGAQYWMMPVRED